MRRSRQFSIHLKNLCPVCLNTAVRSVPAGPCPGCDRLMARLARLHGEHYLTAKTAARRLLRSKAKGLAC